MKENSLTASNEQSQRMWVLVLASLASFMVALDGLVVSTALSTIRKDLSASIEQLEWIVNAYSLSFAVLLMTGAALGDRFGRRRMFVLGLALFVTASAAGALAGSANALIAARALQGAGAALVMPLALALLSAAVPPEHRGRALGIFSGVTGLALIAGPVVGGIIAQGMAWQWIFWLNIPIGLLVIPLVLNRIEESFGPTTAIDTSGIALVTGAALGVVWGLVRGNSAGWGSLEVAGTMGVGVVLLVVFVAYELRARAPMMPMRLFRSRAFALGNTAGFLLFASLTGALFFLAQFLQSGQGYGPLDAGLRLLPWTTTLFVVAPLSGAFVNRIGERPLLVGGLLLQAVGMAWIALIAAPTLAYTQLIVPLIVAGCGVSMAIPVAQTAVMGAVAPHEIGKASGTFNMLRQLGGVFGVTVLVAVFARSGGFGSAQAFSDGFVWAIGVAATLSFAGAIAGLGLPSRRASASLPAVAKS